MPRTCNGSPKRFWRYKHWGEGACGFAQLWTVRSAGGRCRHFQCSNCATQLGVVTGSLPGLFIASVAADSSSFSDAPLIVSLMASVSGRVLRHGTAALSDHEAECAHFHPTNSETSYARCNWESLLHQALNLGFQMTYCSTPVLSVIAANPLQERMCHSNKREFQHTRFHESEFLHRGFSVARLGLRKQESGVTTTSVGGCANISEILDGRTTSPVRTSARQCGQAHSYTLAGTPLSPPLTKVSLAVVLDLMTTLAEYQNPALVHHHCAALR